MVCDYYVDTSLVIEYLSADNRLCKITTDYGNKKRYLSNQKLDDLNDKLKKHTYIKILYEQNSWIKDSYQKKYEKRLKRDFPLIHKLNKVYKSVNAEKT